MVPALVKRAAKQKRLFAETPLTAQNSLPIISTSDFFQAIRAYRSSFHGEQVSEFDFPQQNIHPPRSCLRSRFWTASSALGRRCGLSRVTGSKLSIPSRSRLNLLESKSRVNQLRGMRCRRSAEVESKRCGLWWVLDLGGGGFVSGFRSRICVHSYRRESNSFERSGKYGRVFNILIGCKAMRSVPIA
jgi:hypothetical protein